MLITVKDLELLIAAAGVAERGVIGTVAQDTLGRELGRLRASLYTLLHSAEHDATFALEIES